MIKINIGIIEDFFKVAKGVFGLGEFHCYTIKSMGGKIYLWLLLTILIVQQEYKTKTQLQILTEDDIVQNTSVYKKNNKKKDKINNDKKSQMPLNTGQQKLEKEIYTTLDCFT